MRAREFISELNMSPGRLTGFAQSEIGQKVVAGFEAELVFTKLDGGSDSDDELEPDYDRDEDIGNNIDIDYIKEFFDLHDSVVQWIQHVYEEYVDEKYGEWSEENRDDTYAAIRDEEEELAARAEEGDSDAEDRLFDLTTDRLHDDYYNFHSPSVKDWLHHRGIYTMSDLSRSDLSRDYHFYWPYQKAVGDWRDSADTVADYITKLTGQKAEVLSQYHGDTKYPNIWYVEPDSSIRCDTDEFGAEVVSPPMPLPDLLATLETVLGGLASKWGATSNESTGFHVGVSFKDIPNSQVDYVKLALFLGDEYILSQFRRHNSIYAKNTLRDLQSKAANLDQQEMAVIYSEMRDGLSSSAASIIAKRNANRSMTINVKDNYIELRSMGNDYMSKLPLVKNMIMRYAQAYAVAIDPNAYKQEYAKKLTKLVGSTGNDDLAPFVEYVTRLNTIKTAVAKKANPFDDPRTAKNALKNTLKGRINPNPNLRIQRSPAPKFPDPKPRPQQPLVQFPKPTDLPPDQSTQSNQNNQNNG